jgi:hypothetical protein
VTTPGQGVRIFFDANLIGAGKVLGQTDGRIVYPGHPSWPLDQDEADEVWLSFVGGDHWLVIIRDRKMRYRHVEQMALIENRVRVVNVATKSNLRVQETVDLLLDNWSDIEGTLESAPAFYHLTMAGLKEMLSYP